MIAWTPEYPRYKRPLGYLRMMLCRTKFYDYYRLMRLAGFRFGLVNMPGYRERLAQLHNIHTGRRAFVLGTGPSLRIEDVRQLEGEVTFGCNGLYKMYEELGWSTTYHTVIDRTQLEDRASDLNRLSGTTLLAPLFGAYCIKPRERTIFMPFRMGQMILATSIRSSRKDASSVVWDGMTVTVANLQLAYHMGIRRGHHDWD